MTASPIPEGARHGWRAWAVVPVLVALVALVASSCATAGARGISAPPTLPPDIHPLPPPSVATTTTPPVVVAAALIRRDGTVLPDPALTPGAVYGDVVASDVCDTRYTKGISKPSYSREIEVFAAYGIPTEQADFYVIDHLIPVGLGGSNALDNLWPIRVDEPVGMVRKDELEVRLRDLVCAGQLDLAAAQRAIATDWPSEFESQFGLPPEPVVTTTVPPGEPGGIEVDAPCAVEGEFGIDVKGRRLVCTATNGGGLEWQRRN